MSDEQWFCYRCGGKYPRPTFEEGFDANGHAAGVYYCPGCRRSSGEIRAAEREFYNTALGVPYEFKQEFQNEPWKRPEPEQPEIKLRQHEYKPLRLTFTEGERSQRFDDLIRDYYHAPQLEAAAKAQAILDEAYPPNYYPGEREFLMRTCRSNPTFKDLVDDYFRPVYLSDLWFTYYA